LTRITSEKKGRACEIKRGGGGREKGRRALILLFGRREKRKDLGTGTFIDYQTGGKEKKGLKGGGGEKRRKRRPSLSITAIRVRKIREREKK